MPFDNPSDPVGTWSVALRPQVALGLPFRDIIKFSNLNITFPHMKSNNLQ
jgi:hypothetical protein